MKKLLLLLAITPIFLVAQPEYRTIKSQILNQKREIKIQFPRNYNNNKQKSYPVIYVLDGDYLFEPVAGNVDYFGYWGDMPEAIVVGVNQLRTRQEDTYYDQANYFPADSGADFFEFLGMELMPLVDKEFRTANFSIVVGHDLTANFINYYLFKENPLFKGYINLSPDYAPEMEERVFDALEYSETKIWYYLATGTEDVSSLRKGVLAMNEKLSQLTNKLVHYDFDNFEGDNHYSLVAKAIPNALENMFTLYRPITQYDYEKLLADDEMTNYYEYLTQKYEEIESQYGLSLPVRTNDILAVSNAIIEKEKWEQLKDLAKLASDEHPDSMLGYYLLGYHYEAIGKPKRALKEYQAGYVAKPVAFINKELMMNKIDQIKADFGE